MSEPQAKPETGASIDSAEIAKFERLAATWWDAAGPMKPLHKFNPVRLAYLRDRILAQFGRDPRAAKPLDGLRIVDVGCGGGLLCEPLARLGAQMTGVDPAKTNIEVAKLHAAQSGLTIDYHATPIEGLAAAGERYDVVLAMEVVEHVADIEAFCAACAACVAPGGMLVMATLNRTVRSFALAIVGAEYVLRWLPVGTHSWSKFVTPAELETVLLAQGLTIAETNGVTYNPLLDRWSLSKDTAVNYMMRATRG